MLELTFDIQKIENVNEPAKNVKLLLKILSETPCRKELWKSKQYQISKSILIEETVNFRFPIIGSISFDIYKAIPIKGQSLYSSLKLNLTEIKLDDINVLKNEEATIYVKISDLKLINAELKNEKSPKIEEKLLITAISSCNFNFSLMHISQLHPFADLSSKYQTSLRNAKFSSNKLDKYYENSVIIDVDSTFCLWNGFQPIISSESTNYVILSVYSIDNESINKLYCAQIKMQANKSILSIKINHDDKNSLKFQPKSLVMDSTLVFDGLSKLTNSIIKSSKLVTDTPVMIKESQISVHLHSAGVETSDIYAISLKNSGEVHDTCFFNKKTSWGQSITSEKSNYSRTTLKINIDRLKSDYSHIIFALLCNKCSLSDIAGSELKVKDGNQYYLFAIPESTDSASYVCYLEKKNGKWYLHPLNRTVEAITHLGLSKQIQEYFYPNLH